MAMTQTSVNVNVRAVTVRAATSVPSAVTYGPLATAQSHRTATAQVRQTSFANERRTAAADSRSTATARAYRTVSARYIVTAKTGLVATSRIRTPTADFRRTSVAQTRLTAAVLAPTVAAQARFTATTQEQLDQLMGTAQVEMSTAIARGAATARTLHTPSAAIAVTAQAPVSTAHARRTADSHALTGTAHAATSSARMATARHRLNLAATAQARRTDMARHRLTVTALVPTVVAQARLTLTARAAITSRAEDAFLVATTDARMTTRARLVAAAHTRTAETRRTAFAHAATSQAFTTTARAPTVAVRRATALATARTATARARQTATARAATARIRRTATYYVRHGGHVNVRSCASTTCARVGTIPPGQAIAVLREEAGDPVNGDTRWLAFTFDGQTRYLHASLATMTQPTEPPRPTRTLIPTRTPRSTVTMAIRSQPPETFYVSSTVGANARPCPTLTESCASVRRFNYRDSVTVVGETRGDAYQGSTLWKVIEHGNQRLYIHATLLSRSRPAAVVNPTAPRTGGGSAGGGASGIGRSSEYVPGSCAEVRRVTGSCNFPPGDPNYSRRRDRDNDNLACEC